MRRRRKDRKQTKTKKFYEQIFDVIQKINLQRELLLEHTMGRVLVDQLPIKQISLDRTPAASAQQVRL